MQNCYHLRTKFLSALLKREIFGLIPKQMVLLSFENYAKIRYEWNVYGIISLECLFPILCLNLFYLFPEPLLLLIIIIFYETLARGKAPGEIWERFKRRQQTETYGSFSLMPAFKQIESVLSLGIFRAIFIYTKWQNQINYIRRKIVHYSLTKISLFNVWITYMRFTPLYNLYLVFFSFAAW